MTFDLHSQLCSAGLPGVFMSYIVAYCLAADQIW